MNEEALKSRVIGTVFLCLGIVLTYCNYSMREKTGSYYLQLAFISPVIICIAVSLVIEAPKIPVSKMSIFGWICLCIGIGVGFWNVIL